MKLINTKRFNYLYDSNSNSIIKLKNHSNQKIEYNFESFRNELIKAKAFNEPFKADFNTLDLNNLIDRLNNNLEHLILNVTNDCNFRCHYCAYSGNYNIKRTHSKETMPSNIAYNALDYFLTRASKSENLYIGFYGGEPLSEISLIKSILKRVNTQYSILQPKVQYSVTTNGLLLKPQIIEFLSENNFKVSISLDGPEKIHNKYRKTINGGPTFDRIIRNLEFWGKNFPKYYSKNVRFEATITPPYELLKINEFFHNNPLTKDNFTRFNFVNLIDELQDDTFIINTAEIDNNLKKCKDVLIKNIVEGNFESILPLFRLWFPYLKRIHNRERINSAMLLNPNGICTPGIHRLFVNSKGDFKLCEKLDHFISIGDIKNGFNYETIKTLIKTYTDDVKKNCCDCWAKYFCNLCFTCVAGKERMDLKNKSKFCNYLRKRVEFVLQLYLEVLEKNPEAFDNISSMDDE